MPSEATDSTRRRDEEREDEAGAFAPDKSSQPDRFTLFKRGNSSKVACQLANIHFLAEGENGAILHFGGNSQVNVSQSFDEVLALLNGVPGRGTG